MPVEAPESFEEEAEVIERFARNYRQRFGQLIEQLNRAPQSRISSQCMRLCVEAMDMVLSSQDQMAQAIRRLDRSQHRSAANDPVSA
jgi:hypothetical protein